LAYKKRKKNVSGFEKFCKAELVRVKKARSHSTRAKSTLKYQECLRDKHDLHTGAGKPKKKSM
jgi:hypothetical protein